MDGTSPERREALPKGYTFHWYEIISVLGSGNFGVTYLAKDKNLDQYVAIKEYLPADIATREFGDTVHPTQGERRDLYKWGLVRFIREARILAKFKHRNIVRVLSVFEQNNTAYMVMEYEQGSDFSRVLVRMPCQSQQELLDIFLPILDGLKLIHDEGFIHRDIKPSNIYIRTDGSPVLIDFGSARQQSNSATQTVTCLVTPGYAPFEQFNDELNKQGPWTDLYSIGACLYFAITRKLPINALARSASVISSGIDPYERLSLIDVAGEYSANFLRAIDYSLQFRPEDRPQNVAVWVDMLSGKVAAPRPEGDMPQQGSGSDQETIRISESITKKTENDGTEILNRRPSEPSPLDGQNTHNIDLNSKAHIKSKPLAIIIFISVLLVGGISYLSLKPMKGNDAASIIPISEQSQTKEWLDRRLAELDCSSIGAETKGDDVILSGFASSDIDLRQLVTELKKRLGTGYVESSSVSIYPHPYCDVAKVIEPIRVKGTGGLRIQLKGGATSLSSGDKVSVEIKNGNYPDFVYASIVDPQGDVGHLLPNKGEPNNRLMPGQTIIAGDKGPDGRGWEVSKPYGRHLLLLIASTAQIGNSDRAPVEDIKSYLQLVKQNLKNKTPNDKFSAYYTFINLGKSK